ncbi:MAG: hypothetical protein IPK52_10770 [Chloroflexi bacterium]|nr:hypothetical protein [Chloroflexota bacterium]
MGRNQGMTARHVTEQGTGIVSLTENSWGLHLPSASATAYNNAMVTSYQTRDDFDYGVGSRLELTASSEGELQELLGLASGIIHTRAGYDCLAPCGSSLRLRRAICKLAAGVPGFGSKCAVFDAQRRTFYGLLPLAPVGVLMMRVPFLYRKLWPIGQRAIGVDEYALDTALLLTPAQIL